jgi:hypothetical protein
LSDHGDSRHELVRAAFRQSLQQHLAPVQDIPGSAGALGDLQLRLMTLLQTAPAHADPVENIGNRAILAASLEAAIRDLVAA